MKHWLSGWLWQLQLNWYCEYAVKMASISKGLCSLCLVGNVIFLSGFVGQSK